MSSNSPNGALDKALPTNTGICYRDLMLNHGFVDQAIFHHVYPGSGNQEDPYIVGWIDHDPRNPLFFTDRTKWFWTLLVALANMAVALSTSAYTAPAKEIREEFQVSQEVFELGLSVFVLGFAVGPFFWAPLSELYGRQIVFLGTFIALTAFNVGCAVASNIGGLIIMRFLAGAFGSSPLTNAGGVVADIWPVRQRGLALVAFSSAPLFGPALGPIVGGFLGQRCGWRWVEGFLAILSGTMCLLVAFLVPETYGPLLLHRRAQTLSASTGNYYLSKISSNEQQTTLKAKLQVTMARPWLMLFREPIVLILTIYLALLYGILYMFFGAFPIVYQDHRRWSEEIGGLSFIGLAVGILLGIIYMFPETHRYHKIADRHVETPESRLPPSIVGSITIPIGLIWFAWTNAPSVHWLVSIAAQVPFGFGFVLVYISVQEYLVDAYTIYAASVLAANTIFRSAFGAVFPLFTNYMYLNLGDHWASSIPAFLALACVPFPALFWRYGKRVRARCSYSMKATDHMRQMRDLV